ncbi:MAG: HAD family hydrolase [Nanoarchaeota archaeon]
MDLSSIKVVALDVYGTMIANEDHQGEFPFRKGLDKFLETCKNRGIDLCAVSDRDIELANIDLCDSGVDLEYFNGMIFRLGRLGEPKNLRRVLSTFMIEPNKLLFIGDDYDTDIVPAKEIGCKFYQIPEYINGRNNGFDINDMVHL